MTFAPADVHVLGGSESIVEVRALEPLPGGTVWLLNSVEPFFIGFDGGGSVVARHGTAGGGPEELRMPAGLVGGGLDGHAWALDYGRHAFIRVSDAGGEWSELELPSADIPPGSVRGAMGLLTPAVRTARLGDEIVLPSSTATMDRGVGAYRMSLLRADLIAFDPRTGSARLVVALSEVLDDPAAGFEATDGGFPLWYRLWAVCGDHLRVHDRVRNELRGFTESGREIEPIELPPVRLSEVSPMEFARAVFPLRQAEVTGAVGGRVTREDSLRLLNRMAERLQGEPHELAAYLPRYVDFRCSDDGVMWLQPIDVAAGGLAGSRTWLRIEPEGAAREVTLPERFDALRFLPDRIWGVQRDAYDVASLAFIDLAPGLR